MDRDLRIRMLLEATDRVTRPLRDIAGGSRTATAAVAQVKQRLDQLKRTSDDIDAFRKLKTEMRASEAAMQQAQTRVAALARQMQEASSPSRQLTRDFEKAKREAAALRGEHERQGESLQQMRDRLRAAGVGTADLARHERDLRAAIDQTNRELTEQSDRLQRADSRARRFASARASFGRIQGMATGFAAGGAASIGVGMTIARPILGGIGEAQKYESVMSDIAQKANLSRVQAAAMGRELLGAARAANQLPDALQEGVDTLAGFGLDPRQAVAMMKPIGRAATAYKAEIADLSAAAFAANDNLKVPIQQTGRVIDVMAEAGKQGAFEIKDMAGAFPALTAGYQALGQTGVGAVADLAAALQIARKGAGDSATAATNVANIIQKISSPATIKAFDKMGINLPNALKKAYAEGKTPLEAIAELTKKATGGDLGKIGFLFEDAQVQQGLRPLIQNMEEYRRIRKEAAGASGTTDKDFAERMNDSAEQTKKLKIQSMALAISMGTVLLPTVNAIVQRVSVFAQGVADLSRRHPTWTKVIVLGAAALTALFLVLGGGAVVLAAFMGPLAIINAGLIAVGVSGGIASVGLLPILGTIALVVAAIAGLAALAYLIIQNWSAITGFFGRMWAYITGAFTGGIGHLAAILVNFSPVGLLYAGFAALMNFLGVSMPARLSDVGKNLILGLIRGITGMLGQLKSAVVGAASSAATWFKQKLGIHSPSRVFAGFGGFMMQGLAQGIDRDAGAPVRRVGALSRALSATMAAGALSAPIAAQSLDLQAQIPTKAGKSSATTTAPAQRSSGSSTPVAPLPPIEIHIHAAPSQSPQDIAREVEAAMRRVQEKNAADRRATYRDDADGADL